MTFKAKISVPATNQTEAKQKLTAFVRLAEQLDGRTLEAVANKLPSLMANPIKWPLVKKELGL